MKWYEPGDRIAVGVSGGKDSLVLLSGLAPLRAYYPKPFEVVALTIDPCFGGQQADFSPISALCASMDVEYHLRRSRLGEIIFEERKEKNPCSLCARMRRGILHNMAKEAGCNKLALGHHFDDAVQTFFMNLFYGGKLSCFSPKISLPQGPLDGPPLNLYRRGGNPVSRTTPCTPRGQKRLPCGRRNQPPGHCFLIANLEHQFPDLRAKVMGAMQRSHLSNW
ncbi:MAG: tRNA 2-thiocytidine biosynthesis TtcA family protein [Acutalibacteraceae bacterium]